MRRHFSLFFVFWGAGILLLAGACSDEGRLIIHTQDKSVRLQVEIAADAPTRRKGLMHRSSLAPDAGMLFDFETQKPVTMWMKNTPLSLDMAFIDTEGIIIHIAANTIPYSLDRIPSNGPARAVLEVNAGYFASHGIAVGDRLEHEMFDAG